MKTNKQVTDAYILVSGLVGVMSGALTEEEKSLYFKVRVQSRHNSISDSDIRNLNMLAASLVLRLDSIIKQSESTGH